MISRGSLAYPGMCSVARNWEAGHIATTPVVPGSVISLAISTSCGTAHGARAAQEDASEGCERERCTGRLCVEL